MLDIAVLVMLSHYSNSIVVIGDSISEGAPITHSSVRGGTEVNHYGSIPYELENRYGIKVHNRGYSGNTSDKVRARWCRDVLQLTPSNVFILVGINDLGTGKSLENLKDNILFFISSAKEHNIIPTIATVGYSRIVKEEYQENILKFNEFLYEQNVSVYDYYGWTIIHQDMIPDGLHPSPEGYESIGKDIRLPID